jgi:hypothetical protein
MKTENFNRAKEIEKEIESMKDFIKPMRKMEDKECLGLEKRYYGKYNGWEVQKIYAVGNNTYTFPEFLKEQIIDDLEFVRERLVRKVDKHIAELEKEFESL